MGNEYRHKIYDIAVKTFEVACYMFPLEEEELDSENQTSPEGHTMAAVAFHGASEGKMFIFPSDELLTAIAGNMLGIEDPTEEQKSGALCEVANIICGNTVALFAQNEKICYIKPPYIIEDKEAVYKQEDNMKKESFKVFLNEGSAEITISYSEEKNL